MDAGTDLPGLLGEDELFQAGILGDRDPLDQFFLFQGVQQTAEESARMDKVAEMGVPIIATIPLSESLSMTSVFFRVYGTGDTVGVAFNATLMRETYSIVLYEAGWTVVKE